VRHQRLDNFYAALQQNFYTPDRWRGQDENAALQHDVPILLVVLTADICPLLQSHSPTYSKCVISYPLTWTNDGAGE
jgi:hypothetical protein